MPKSPRKKSAQGAEKILFEKPGVVKTSPKDGQEQPPKVIYAQVSPHSIGGVSMFEAGPSINADTAAYFTSEPQLIQVAAARLREAGFTILQATESTINIAGSQKTYEQAFNTQIVVRQEEVIKEGAVRDMAEFLDSPSTDMPGLISTRNTRFADLIEGVALEEPRYYMQANPFPPRRSYWHHDVPGGISLGCNADRAHRAGITGRDIVVAMCDSGWFRHPFFTERGYRADNAILGPAAANPLADESGHGTGESANIFSVAPDVRLRPVKMNFVNSVGAFNVAVGLNPHIITCSWGSSVQFGPLSAANIVLADAIAAAVAAGIIVVFSAGNGHFGFPGQHPDVISAGGVYIEPNNTLRASNYASGFASNVYPGRNAPDLCGIVGLLPRAMNIMLPLQPGCSIDVGNSGGVHPNGDETPNNDGWAAFSGTSAAAPQLAGAAALVKQACARLTPAQVRDILRSTARDVTVGASQQGNAAGVGPDLATGHGLVDAHRATMLARLRCTPIISITPTPIQPTPIIPISIQPTPIVPIPIQPTPIVPTPQPIRPIQPIQPIQPVQPIRPIRPIGPVVQPGPIPASQAAPAAPAAPPQGGPQLTEEELDTLADMVNKGQVDPGEV